MSIVIALIFAASPTATIAAMPICQNNKPVLVEGKRQPRVHPLGQEPPARQVLTVVRTFDGCSRPVVIREDIGAPKR